MAPEKGRKTVTEWSVELEIPHRLGFTKALENLVGDVLEALARNSAVAAHDRHALSVRLTIEAKTAVAALARARQALTSALRKVGFQDTVSLVRVEVETMKDLDRRLQESHTPEIVGVTEVAGILGVSKQRVSELARSRDFPPPIVMLAAGPVWLQSSIVQFVSRWHRRPGRRRTAVVGAR